MVPCCCCCCCFFGWWVLTCKNRFIDLLCWEFQKVLPIELKPPAWTIALVVRSLTPRSYKPLRLASDKHPSHETCFLVALVSAERVSDLHSLLYEVKYFRGLNSCTLFLVPAFMAKIHSLSVPDLCFQEFCILSLKHFADNNREELLMCLVWAVIHNLSIMEQYHSH